MSARNATMIAGVVLACILGAWLRLHALGAQVIQDDEWHAIHKLMTSGYADIFASFGMADHSIPLTLLYKAMADTIGLTEINMRIVQAVAGIALIPCCAAIAWRMTRNSAVSVLAAFLVAGAPFLVLYSRTARPYAITSLLVVAVLAASWQWRESRSRLLGLAICLLTALSAWLHPISAVFPAVAMAFIFAEDLRTGKNIRSTFALGVGSAFAIAALLGTPLANDWQSLATKAGGDHAGLYTLSRMLSLYAGGLPDAVTIVMAAIALFGAIQLVRTRTALGFYLLVLAIAPIATFMALGASWTHQGHTFGRYVFPVQLVFLLWLAVGVIEIATRLRAVTARAQMMVAVAVAAAYLALNPAIRQVATLGPWYGHAYHHFDYVDRHNVAARQYDGYDAPRFYKQLGELAPATAPVIEAPFTYEAPANSMAFFRRFHHQPEKLGMLHDLCLGGRYYGEVPNDSRFRFRNFVFLADPRAVRASGARYLLLHRDQLHGKPFVEADRCMAVLTSLYGAPVDVDPRLAVFDLRPESAPRKLQ